MSNVNSRRSNAINTLCEEKRQLENKITELKVVIKNLSKPLECGEIVNEAKHPEDWHRAMSVYTSKALEE